LWSSDSKLSGNICFIIGKQSQKNKENNSIISCLLTGDFPISLPFLVGILISILRQFKIVTPTRQPGGKTNKLQKIKLPLYVVWTSKITKL
jgi:hypothetical protein